MRVALALVALASLAGSRSPRRIGAPRARAAGEAPADAGRDARARRSPTGARCVEHVPAGATRPEITEVFPDARHERLRRARSRSPSSTARARRCCREGFQVADRASDAAGARGGGLRHPRSRRRRRPRRSRRRRARAASTTKLTIPFVALPKKPGRNVMMLPPVPIAIARASGELVTVCTQPHPIVVEDPIANELDPKVAAEPAAAAAARGVDARRSSSRIGAARRRGRRGAPRVALRCAGRGARSPCPAAAAASARGSVGARGARRGPHVEPARREQERRRVLRSRERLRAQVPRRALRLRRPRDDDRRDGRATLAARAPAGASSSTRSLAFLDECDLVKFARVTPDGRTTARAALERGEHIVRVTIPPQAATPRRAATPGRRRTGGARYEASAARSRRAARSSSHARRVAAGARLPARRAQWAWLGVTLAASVVLARARASCRSSSGGARSAQDERTPRLRIGHDRAAPRRARAACARGSAICPACCAPSRSRCSSLAMARPVSAILPRHGERRQGHRHRGRARPLGLDARGARRRPAGPAGPRRSCRAASASRASTRRRSSSGLHRPAQDRPHRRRRVRQERLRALAADARLPPARRARRQDDARRHRRQRAPPSATRVGTAVARLRRSDAQSKVDHPAHRRRLNAGSIAPEYATHLATTRRRARSTRSRSATATRSTSQDGVDLLRPAAATCARRFPVNPELLEEDRRATTGGEAYIATDAQGARRRACTTCSTSSRRRASRRAIASFEDLFPFLLMPGVAARRRSTRSCARGSCGGSRELRRARCSSSARSLALVVAGALRARRRSAPRRASRAFGDPERDPRARHGATRRSGARGRACSLVLATALAFVALARPQYGKGTRLIPATNLDVVIVLDYSKSMYARDVEPSRIVRAKVEVARLIKDLEGARFGAVAFAGEPMGFPLTADGAAIAQFLRQLEPNDMPVGGTAIARALDAGARAARGAIPKSREHKRIILLVTDGEDLEGDPGRRRAGDRRRGDDDPRRADRRTHARAHPRDRRRRARSPAGAPTGTASRSRRRSRPRARSSSPRSPRRRPAGKIVRAEQGHDGHRRRSPPS